MKRQDLPSFVFLFLCTSSWLLPRAWAARGLRRQQHGREEDEQLLHRRKDNNDGINENKGNNKNNTETTTIDVWTRCTLKLVGATGLHNNGNGTQQKVREDFMTCVFDEDEQETDVATTAFPDPLEVRISNAHNANHKEDERSLLELAARGTTILHATQQEVEQGWMSLLDKNRNLQHERRHRRMETDALADDIQSRTLMDITMAPLMPVEAPLCESGLRTVRLIRVMFTDAQPSISLNQWQADTVDAAVTVLNQFEECSGGQVSMQFLGAHNVRIKKSAWDFQTFQKNLYALTKELLALSPLKDMDSATRGDHLLFCVPKAPFRKGRHAMEFTGIASVNGDKVVLQDPWCSDFRTVVHEVGHNCGLGHSNLAGDNGNMWDITWTMSLTGFKPVVAGPSKCFSPHDMVRMGWFRAYTFFLTEDDAKQGLKINLVGYTQHIKLRKKDADPIVVAFDNYRILLNMADSFNEGTESCRNGVTVLEAQGKDSIFVACIEEKHQMELKGLIFRVCKCTEPYSRFHSCHLVISTDGKCNTPMVDQVMDVVDSSGNRRGLLSVPSAHRLMSSMDNDSNYNNNQPQLDNRLLALPSPSLSSSSSSSSALLMAAQSNYSNSTAMTGHTFGRTLREHGTNRTLTLSKKLLRPDCFGETVPLYRVRFVWPFSNNGGNGKVVSKLCPWIVMKQPALRRNIVCTQLNELSPVPREIWKYCKVECCLAAQCLPWR